MGKKFYSKPSLTYSEQLQQLIDRGLKISNTEKSIHLLETISYYRLSGYWHPFLADKEKHVFKDGASFDLAFHLYCFDRKLRQLIFSEIEKIEIGVRAKMVYIMASKHEGFWLENKDLFDKQDKHIRLLEDLKKAYSRSDEIFIASFKDKYSNELPPSWIILEIISLGSISKIYNNLNRSIEKRLIATYFGLSDYVFTNWLHTLTYLRNICAHHTRLWNRKMGISPTLVRNPKNIWLKNDDVRNDKLFFLMSIIMYFQKTINPHNKFKKKFLNLLLEYPNVDIKAMGFYQDWEKEPLWQ